MARPILLSNGEMHVGLNNFSEVHDFYYPYVGLENHAAARNLRHRVGVFVDGQISWLDDGRWKFQQDYPHQSLVGRTIATNQSLGVILQMEDAVDYAQAAFLRNIHVINSSDQPRQIKLFMHQAFAISNSSRGDTAQYLPKENAILHYKGHRSFIVGGQTDSRPFDQFSVGLFGIEGHEGSYRDADDGWLSGNAAEHGSVDSILGFYLDCKAQDSKRVNYWIAAGKSAREALVINNRLHREGLVHRLVETDAYWQKWLAPAEEAIKFLPEDNRDRFRNSLLLLKAQIDNHGAVIASTDTTMLNYARDAYAYSWPRDASYGLWPLIRLGYRDEPLQYFQFCRRGLHKEGYLMHKYQADGALGSSWHPYTVYGKQVIPPIQTDETALTLFIAGEYFREQPNEPILKELYQYLFAPMANFLSSFINPHNKLPLPSFDLWEQRLLTTTYTTAVTYAGLLAAVKLAEHLNQPKDALYWQTTAEDIKAAAAKHLYNNERNFFIKGLWSDPDDNSLSINNSVDVSALYGAYIFGLFDQNSAEIKSSYHTLKQVFSIGPERPFVGRYERDDYNIVDPASLGNPWIITTLWLAQLANALDDDELATASLDWVNQRMLSTGALPEQINPHNFNAVSVSPLTWSQAEYLSTVLDLATKFHHNSKKHHED